MVKVLFDHNMPPSIAYALNEIVKLTGHEAVALEDKFRKDIADIDYFDILQETSAKLRDSLIVTWVIT